MISEFSCPGGAREPISPTQLDEWMRRGLLVVNPATVR